MITIRAGPTVSSLNERRYYLIHVACGIERESVLSGNEIAVQDNKVGLFLRKNLGHEGGRVFVCWNAKGAFIFTIVQIRENCDMKGIVSSKM